MTWRSLPNGTPSLQGSLRAVYDLGMTRSRHWQYLSSDEARRPKTETALRSPRSCRPAEQRFWAGLIRSGVMVSSVVGKFGPRNWKAAFASGPGIRFVRRAGAKVVAGELPCPISPLHSAKFACSAGTRFQIRPVTHEVTAAGA
jgi:hypothetical protein